MFGYNESGALDPQIAVSRLYIGNALRISNHRPLEFGKLEERNEVFTALPYLYLNDGFDL